MEDGLSAFNTKEAGSKKFISKMFLSFLMIHKFCKLKPPYQKGEIIYFGHSQSNKVSLQLSIILVLTIQFINFWYVCTGVPDCSLANSFADDGRREIKARPPSLLRCLSAGRMKSFYYYKRIININIYREQYCNTIISFNTTEATVCVSTREC